MVRLTIGLALLGGVVFLGRRRSSGLSGPERTFVERTLDDVMGFTLHQFPLLELSIDDDPLVTNPEHQMQCKVVEPYLASATRHLFEALSRGEHGSKETRVLVAQATSAAFQPGRCHIRMPELLLSPDDDEAEES